MAAKQLTPTETIDATPYHTAMAALAAADATLVDARKRIADTEALAVELGVQAATLEKKRGTALARGEMTDAANFGKQFAAASDGAKEAHRAVEAMTGALDDLWIAVLEAEKAASAAHRQVMGAHYEAERAALVKSLRATVYATWRAGLASGNPLPFDTWWQDLGAELDRTDMLEIAVDLPIAEDGPSSSLLPGDPRRGSNRRADIAAMRDRKLLAAQAADLGGQAA